MEGVVRLFGIWEKPNQTHQAGSVYGVDGLSPCLDTATGGYREPLILEDMRNKKLSLTLEKNQVRDTCAIDGYNKVIHYDCFQTINTGVSYRNQDYIGELEMEKDEPKVLAGIGEKKSNGGTQYYEQDRIYDVDKVATTIPAEKSFHPYYGGNLKIRKLTPCECLRLMAFSKEDYLNLVTEGEQSSSSIYHCAGDSIVVNVLIGLFAGLVGADAEVVQKRWAERVSHGLDGSENANKGDEDGEFQME